MPKGIPLTREEQMRRRREIFNAAARLFAEQGFNETSMREIAGAAGVGKSTLYDYFPTKDDVLLFIFEEELDAFLLQARAVEVMQISALEKVKRLLDLQLGVLLSKKSLYLKLMDQVQRLKPQSIQRLQTRRYAYQDMLRDLIAQGIRAGEIRQVDPFIAVKVLQAVMTPMIFTTRPTGTPREMLDKALDIVLNGLLPA